MKSLLESIIGRTSIQSDPFKFIERTWGKDKYLKLMGVIEEAKNFGGGKDVRNDKKWKDLFTYILQHKMTLLSKDFSDAIISYFDDAPYVGDLGASDVFAEYFKNSNWEAMVEDILFYIENL